MEWSIKTNRNITNNTDTEGFRDLMFSQKIIYSELTVNVVLTVYLKGLNHMSGLLTVTCTCSAINLKPLSGLSHSYVSPRTGLKGLLPALW